MTKIFCHNNILCLYENECEKVNSSFTNRNHWLLTRIKRIALYVFFKFYHIEILCEYWAPPVHWNTGIKFFFHKYWKESPTKCVNPKQIAFFISTSHIWMQFMSWWVEFISIPNESCGRHLMGHLIKSQNDIMDLWANPSSKNSANLYLLVGILEEKCGYLSEICDGFETINILVRCRNELFDGNIHK